MTIAVAVPALLSFLAQAAPAPDLSIYRMEPMGWVFMCGSITAVLSLVVFCYWKVLTTPRAAEHMHVPLDIETEDTDT